MRGELPVLEQFPPAIGSFGEAERDVTQIDHQAGEPPRDFDIEMPSASTQPDAVAELEFRGRGGPGRERHDLESARQQVDRRGATPSPWGCRTR